MDKEFEKKIKQKRLRSIAVAIIVLASITYLIAGTRVEKADYTKSLDKEIEKAQELLENNKGNTGNGRDKYAPYTLLKFEKDIEKAIAVAEDETGEYSAKKLAYETLQVQVKTFAKETNAPVIEEVEVESLIREQALKEVKATIKDSKEVVYRIDGRKLKEAETMNLMAREEGPYYDDIEALLAEKKLQGQVISFYQDGSFGGELEIQLPISCDDETKGYVYQVNLTKEKLSFVSVAEIDAKEQCASFTITMGGDYVVLKEKIHKDKASTQVKGEEQAEESEEAVEKSDDEGATSSKAEKTEKTDKEQEDNAVDASADEPEAAANEKETREKVENPQKTLTEEKPQAQTTKDEAVAETEDAQEDAQDAQEDAQEDTQDTDETAGLVTEEAETIIVSINILCDTLAADLSKLQDPALKSYVPKDGVILSLAEVETEKGASVYDVLNKVCRDNGIHLEAVYTPSYGADYVEGINYLYEFDAGEQSGWMYQVNGVFPNYGCSEYILENGDAVVWAYTCDMGRDLGKSM